MGNYKKRRNDGRFNPPNTAKPKPLAGEAAGSLSAIFGVLKKKAEEPQSSGAPDGGAADGRITLPMTAPPKRMSRGSRAPKRNLRQNRPKAKR